MCVQYVTKKKLKISDNYLDSDLFHAFVHGISVLFSIYQYFEPRHLGLTLSLGTWPADMSDQLTCVVFKRSEAVLQDFLYPGQCVSPFNYTSVLFCSQWVRQSTNFFKFMTNFSY